MKLYLYCITFAESGIFHFFSFIHILEDIPTDSNKTRTKTSIRYAKENDREKRERRKERERKVKGEI